MSEALRDAAKVALAALELHARTYPHMVKGYTHDAANMLRAALAQPQAPSVPAGWKLVPVEPTEAMGEAYLAAAKLHAAVGAKDTMRFSWGGYRAMLAAAPQAAQEAAPANPMDWPLPCDVVVGHGTMRKGVRLGALVSRMKALYEMATGQNADEVAGRSLEQRLAAPGLLQQADAAQEAAGAVAPADDIAVLVDAYGMATADEAGSGHKSAQAYAALAKSNLMDAIKALAVAPAEPIPTRATLIAALQWYADGLHFDKASPDAWDTVSGEPQNWWCDEAGTATIEDGSIAAMTLRGELTAEQLQEFEAGEAAAPVGLDAKAATERDAARYRWLRSTTNWASSKGERVDVRNNPELWDSAIDAALAAAPQAQAAPPATEVQP